MRHLTGLCLPILALIFTVNTFAQTKKEDPTLDPFYDQVEQINKLVPTVERVDLSRLLVINKMIGMITEDIKNNRSAKKKEVTFQTLRLIQGLIIQYRFSKVFFGWTTPRSLVSIYTDNTAEVLKRLEDLSKALSDEYGYDDQPYTQITANTFKQMHKLLGEVQKLNLNVAFKEELLSLYQPIGQTIAIAEQGDRPKAFAQATEVSNRIRTMYPKFDAISSSNAGFQVILELQGLNEFYAEFAQME